MNCGYTDIRNKISEEPQWWDEHCVPRYCEFHPSRIADIYAGECALLLTACQACGRRFKVAVSQNRWSENERPLKEWIGKGGYWRDPPNVGCCAAGPTMTSNVIEVLGIWTKNKYRIWKKDDFESECDVNVDFEEEE